MMWKSTFNREGAHYNLFEINPSNSMSGLRALFPDATADEMNFCLFSTSGVHGTYNTIEEAEEHLKNPSEETCEEVTFVVIQPRLCCLRYGNVTPQSLEDIKFLKKLRKTSWAAMKEIGK